MMEQRPSAHPQPTPTKTVSDSPPPHTPARAKPKCQVVFMVNRYPFGAAHPYPQQQKPIVLLTRRCAPNEQDQIRHKIQHHSKLRHPNLIRILKAYQSRKKMFFDVHLQYVHMPLRKCHGKLSPQLVEDNKLRLINLCSYLLSVNIYPEIAEEVLGVDQEGLIKLYLDIDFRVLSPGINKSELFKVKEVEINNILNQYISLQLIHTLNPLIPIALAASPHSSSRSNSGKNNNVIIYTSRSVDTPQRFTTFPQQLSAYNNEQQNISTDSIQRNNTPVAAITLSPPPASKPARQENNRIGSPTKQLPNIASQINSSQPPSNVRIGRNRHMSTVIPSGNLSKDRDIHSSMHSGNNIHNASMNTNLSPPVHRFDESYVVRPFGPKSSNASNIILKNSVGSSCHQKRTKFLQEYAAFQLEGPTTVGRTNSNMPTVIDEGKRSKLIDEPLQAFIPGQNKSKMGSAALHTVKSTGDLHSTNKDNNNTNNQNQFIKTMADELSVIRERSIRRSEPAASSKYLGNAENDRTPRNSNHALESQNNNQETQPKDRNQTLNVSRQQQQVVVSQPAAGGVATIVNQSSKMQQNQQGSSQKPIVFSRQGSKISSMGTANNNNIPIANLELSKVNSQFKQKMEKLEKNDLLIITKQNQQDKTSPHQQPYSSHIASNQQTTRQNDEEEKQIQRRKQRLQEEQWRLQNMEQALLMKKQQQRQQQLQNGAMQTRQMQQLQQQQYQRYDPQQQQILIQQQHQLAEQRIQYVQENSFDTYHQELGQVIEMPKMIHTELRQTTQSPPKLPSPERKTKLHESVGYNTGKFIQEKSKKIQEEDENYTVSQHPQNIQKISNNNNKYLPSQQEQAYAPQGQMFKKKQVNYTSPEAYYQQQQQQYQQTYHHNEQQQYLDRNNPQQLYQHQQQYDTYQDPSQQHQYYSELERQQYLQMQYQMQQQHQQQQYQQNYYSQQQQQYQQMMMEQQQQYQGQQQHYDQQNYDHYDQDNNYAHHQEREDDRAREYLYRMVNVFPEQIQDSRCLTNSDGTGSANKQSSKFQINYRTGPYQIEKDDPLTREFNTLFGDDQTQQYTNQNQNGHYEDSNNNNNYQSYNNNNNNNRITVLDSGHDENDDEYYEIEAPDNKNHSSNNNSARNMVKGGGANGDVYTPSFTHNNPNMASNNNNNYYGNQSDSTNEQEIIHQIPKSPRNQSNQINDRVRMALERSVATLQQFNKFKVNSPRD